MTATTVASGVRGYAFRLTPGQDLKQELLAFAARHDLRAAAILTCVGSLTDVCLRFANRPDGTPRRGHFEIVGLVGTLIAAGGHLHLAVADESGVMFGGHLLDGCLVYTTAEVVLAELGDVQFTRRLDAAFGYQELVVAPR